MFCFRKRKVSLPPANFLYTNYQLRNLRIRGYHAICDARNHKQGRLFPGPSDSPPTNLRISLSSFSVDLRPNNEGTEYLGVHVDHRLISVVLLTEGDLSEADRIQKFSRLLLTKQTADPEAVAESISELLRLSRRHSVPVELALTVSDDKLNQTALSECLQKRLREMDLPIHSRMCLNSASCALIAEQIYSPLCLVAIRFDLSRITAAYMDCLDIYKRAQISEFDFMDLVYAMMTQQQNETFPNNLVVNLFDWINELAETAVGEDLVNCEVDECALKNVFLIMGAKAKRSEREAALRNLNAPPPPQKTDLKVATKICVAALEKLSQVLAAGICAIIDRATFRHKENPFNSSSQTSMVDLCLDGYVFQTYPSLVRKVQEYIALLSPNLIFELSRNAGGCDLGAAIILSRCKIIE